MFTIHVLDRTGKFIRISIVERGHRNEVKRSTLRTVVTAADRADAAGAAELIVKIGVRTSWGCPLIFVLRLRARE